MMTSTATTKKRHPLILWGLAGFIGCLGLAWYVSSDGGRTSRSPFAMCRQRQSEVINNLEAIVIAQQGYLMSNAKPTSSLTELGVGIKGTRYRYAIVVDGDHWRAEATGVGEQQGDVWRADDDTRATNTVPLCRTLQ